MSLNSKKKPLISKFLSSGAIFLVLLTLVYLHISKEQPRTQSYDTQALLTPNEFISLFDSVNSQNAKRFVDKAIEIKGNLKNVTLREGKYTLFINSDEKGRFIMCEMQADQLEKIKNIKEDDIVTVKGIFKGVLLDAILLNCIIIN